MRKSTGFLFEYLIVAAFYLLTGCANDSDPNPKPEVNFSPEAKAVTLPPGDSVNMLTITVTSISKLKSFTIARTDSNQLLQNINTFPEKNYKTKLRDKISADADSGSQVIYKITAITEKDESTTRTFTVNVN